MYLGKVEYQTGQYSEKFGIVRIIEIAQIAQCRHRTLKSVHIALFVDERLGGVTVIGHLVEDFLL